MYKYISILKTNNSANYFNDVLWAELGMIINLGLLGGNVC